MDIVKTDFKDLLIINHEIYYDERGSFKEVFRKNVIEENLGYKIVGYKLELFVLKEACKKIK